MPQPSCSIVVLTYNQLEMTRLCVESLFRHTDAFELVVVDNASKDGTPGYLEELAARHSNVKLILNRENRGFSGGCNQGIAASAGDWIVLLNNDTVVGPRWLATMIDHGERAGAAMLGPRTNEINGPQKVEKVDYDTRSLEGFDAFAARWLETYRDQVSEHNRIVGFCMVVRREVFDRIGGLDSGYSIGNFEDDDFCIRTRLAGFRVLVCEDVLIHHFGSATFTGQRIDYRQTLDRNWLRFKEKWFLTGEFKDGYMFADVMELPFDPDVHTEPLFRPDATTVPLPDRKGFNVVTDADPEALRQVARAYLEAFEEQDDVCLHVLAGARSADAHRILLETLDALGIDPEHIPDISLLDLPAAAMDLPGCIKGADLSLGSPRMIHGALDMGVPTLRTVDVAGMRDVRARSVGATR